jgi:hypothetical protein
MRLSDQHGATAYAWFPPDTPADPEHILPALIYAEVCRVAGLGPSSPWVAFKTRRAALTAMTAAWLTVGLRAGGAPV